MKSHQVGEEEIIEGARMGSMKELYQWVEEADKVISF